PRLLAGFRVEGDDVSADAELSARAADHDLALGDERRQGEVVSVLVVVDLRFPEHLPGPRIERDDEGVEGGDVDLVPVEADATARGVRLDDVLGQLALVAPDEVAGLRVQREHLVAGRSHEHDAVVDEWRRLMTLDRAAGVRPYRFEIAHVLRRDLAERAVAP